MAEQNNTTEEAPFTEVDQTSTNIDAVKKFIADAEGSGNAEEPATDEAIPQDIQEMLGDAPKPEDKDDNRITVPVDKSFENTEARDSFQNMFISVKDTDIPVTEDDKTLYLKALLNDVPVTLSVSASNGATAVCRALSVYESDLVYLALKKFLELHENYPTMLWDAQMQQYKLAMQLTEFAGKPQNYLKFEFGDHSRDEDVMELVEGSEKLFLNRNTIQYGVMLRLMNVFNHKMSRLQEAAFNEDFWKRDDTD